MKESIWLTTHLSTDNRFVLKPHRHDECEVSFILRGSKEVTINDDRISLVAGSLLFINQNIAHITTASSGEKCQFIELHYHPDIALPWQQVTPDIDFSRLYRYAYVAIEPEMMDQTFIRGIMKTLVTAHAEGMRFILYPKLMELIVYLVIKTKLSKARRNLDNRCAGGRKEHIRKKHFNEFTEYIIQRGYNVTLDELSRHFYFSRYYISHLFTEEGGMSFHEYLDVNRMKKAVYMLENTSLPIADIGEECGYNSYSQFGRVFKKYAAIPPSEYRRRNTRK